MTIENLKKKLKVMELKMKSNRLFKISIDYNTFDWAMQPPPPKKTP